MGGKKPKNEMDGKEGKKKEKRKMDDREGGIDG